MDWSAKQTRILTANGLAISRYHTPERGYPVIETDLPHHHIQRGSVACHETLLGWRRSGAGEEEESRRRSPGDLGDDDDDDVPPPPPQSSVITGAWRRTLFHGFYPEGRDEWTTDADETVHNLQTPSLFVDLRIPTTRPRFGDRHGTEELSDDELRLYARQHVFAGYTLLTTEEERSTPSISRREAVERRSRRMVATRHHCIDWNFVSWNPRMIPNRWYVEVVEEVDDVGVEDDAGSSFLSPVVQKWNEWAYATDDSGRHYYLEKWERLGGDEGGRGRVLALKKRPPRPSPSGGAVADDDGDGVLVVVGDHFSYVRGRSQSLLDSLDLSNYRSCAKSLVDLVDEAVARGDRATAEAFLSVEAGHGRIDDGGDDADGGGGGNGGGGGRWRIDSAIPPWREGSSLFGDGDGDGDGVRVEGLSVRDVRVTWDGAPWDVFECSGIGSVGELRELFGIAAEGSEETDCGGDGSDVNGSGAGGLSKL